MVTQFHDIMHKELEVYVDDMIAKSKTEEEHMQVLKKLFMRLRKFQLKLNSAKCTFRVRSGKLLEFVVSERGIEIDPDKVRVIQELPPPRTQKEVRVYVNQKAAKGSAIADFLESRALEDYEPLNFDFPNEDLMYVATTEKDFQEGGPWKLNFDGASNSIACIMGIRAAIERKIKVLEIYGDSALVIYQLKGEWETRDPKLVRYRKLVMELIEEFDSVTFSYLPRDENQMADVLATLASMFKVNKLEDMKPIQISIYEAPAHCCNIDNEGEKDDHPWYHDILRYVKSHEYPDHATKNDKKTLRRLTIDYVLDGDILYKRGKDQVLLRCVDAVEAKKILEEVHEAEVCSQFKIRHHNSSPYRPKMNGAVEAANKNIKKFVGKMTETYKDWHEKLPFALLAYRTSVRTSMGATPFSLAYGMEAVLPIEVEIPSL
ncbi:uncharacterized protein LOC105795690 [Gossypium raimondii]|uniref:uncharacterized protein LOC105795690 n=1 Tax=Gossypium raimondii TaxID=29730 RepID=UPI00227CF9CD|nr:uncharacterized protein LOC105795690 [Gossypium raimondii]